MELKSMLARWGVENERLYKANKPMNRIPKNGVEAMVYV